MSYWRLSHRADPIARLLADRHYNRQKPGTPQFVPPGRCLVLLSKDEQALWVTSWPFAEYVKHAWKGAWVNSLFRREQFATGLASDLILEAIAITRGYFGEPPSLGMITFVDSEKIKSSNPGCCYKYAGFVKAGYAKDGKVCLQLTPERMPLPRTPPPIIARLKKGAKK